MKNYFGLRPAYFWLCGLLLCGTVACKHATYKNFLADEHLKGPVKSVSETFYPVEEKDGQPARGEMYFKTVYAVDKDGNKTEWKELNADGSVKWAARSMYESGKEVECIGYKADGQQDWKTVFTYDEKGNRTGEDEYDAAGNKTARIVFKYNENGLKFEREYYGPDGSLYSKSVYKYDMAGYVAEEAVFDGSGTQKTRNTNKYSNTDSKGNWLLQEIYANDNIAVISERTIEYY